MSMRMREWDMSGIVVAQPVEVESLCVYESGDEDDVGMTSPNRNSFYTGTVVTPTSFDSEVPEVTADIVRLSSPVRFRFRVLGQKEKIGSRLLSAFGHWRSAHAVLGDKHIKLFTKVHAQDHFVVLGSTTGSLFEIPVNKDTQIERRRTPLSFRPTMDCTAKCEIVVTCEMEGQLVELRIVPFVVNEKKGFQVRDCIAAKWERCLSDIVYIQEHMEDYGQRGHSLGRANLDVQFAVAAE